MTVTCTDLFCGAGGSSLGAEAVQGVQLIMAANHWQTAIEVHQSHFPNADHDLADISQADPRRYPVTDVLLASPECTNHSQARGISRKQQNASLWDAPDPAAERSRATMWDVCRFAEQIPYKAIVVENVVEATKWVGWPHWLGMLTDLGYKHRVVSANSMHFGVPQSHDRIYVVLWQKGLRPELEMEVEGFCQRCEKWVPARQAWKNGRTVGRYGQQWIWACLACGTEVNSPTEPAAKIIDWSLPCPKIGDRDRPLAAATRARILAGLQRYGWAPITTTGAGNTFERTPGMRARPLTEPVPVQQSTATTALATPPGYLVHTAHSGDGRFYPLDRPYPTVSASDDRCSLIVPMRSHMHAQGTDEPAPAVTAGGNHHALLMRNNTGGAEMVTPITEPARTMTAHADTQSLLIPYNRTGQPRPVTEAMHTVRTHDNCGLLNPDQVIDECGFRMLEPHEIAAAMAFPKGYIPGDLTKKDQVRLAGNAVTPPAMTWLMGRVVRAIQEA